MKDFHKHKRAAIGARPASLNEIDEALHTLANEWSAIRSKRVRGADCQRNGTLKGIEVCDDSKR